MHSWDHWTLIARVFLFLVFFLPLLYSFRDDIHGLGVTESQEVIIFSLLRESQLENSLFLRECNFYNCEVLQSDNEIHQVDFYFFYEKMFIH